MGRGQGELVRLPLCKKGGATAGGDYMGGVSGPAIQPASVFYCIALCCHVRADGDGHGKYI